MLLSVLELLSVELEVYLTHLLLNQKPFTSEDETWRI